MVDLWTRAGWTGRGSALLEVWDVSAKANSEQQQSSFPLSASSYPSTEKRQCQEKKHVPEIFPAAYVTVPYSLEEKIFLKSTSTLCRPEGLEVSKKKPNSDEGNGTLANQLQGGHLMTSPKGEHEGRKSADPNYPTIQRQPA